MKYRLFGWWWRWQACRMAALVFSNRQHGSDEAVSPMIWSVTVFFESYLREGAEGTREDFGPRAPVELREVADPRS